MNNDQNQLLSKITDLSEDQKLELFSVEELENRLELTAVADSAIDVTGNAVCWIG
ncbi:hypothetical protein [Hymenobacter cellulosilyticus]|uniref:Uncharacterized protein n=1 Tax=Hymenobacter cellulosilyticus TaxID=2932248 RepID=A0A8T9Q5U7_9BACT|nr:hypothetical protein [Hymenobacter cellulosilyticus]UOQ72934.1 hypothetical protein MUN79_02815 [Hymenobacter cellulosilyticus]